jgi:cellulose synthase/poly-beta-1,6-N-acetylglucosamine synthase-like glycosyltransferase
MQIIAYVLIQVFTLALFIIYFHQLVYLFVGMAKEHKLKNKEFKFNRLGVVIPARNEEKVIANLIQSIQENDYPKDKVQIFVIADNCTDRTAQIARDMGCTVFERFNNEKRGKGFALNYMFTKLHTEAEYKDMVPDAYVIFDADNVIKTNFLHEINRTFDAGYDVVTPFRNSKNFGKNWITAGNGLAFMHESRHMNNSRMLLGTSCTITGTGFLIATSLVREYDNWKFFTLAEDMECTAEHVVTKRMVGYCGQAELYDEQPETFKMSWRQRSRWVKGFYQILGIYGIDLFKKSLKKFTFWDILSTIFPALFVTLITTVSFFVLSCISWAVGDGWSAKYCYAMIGYTYLWVFGLVFIIAAVTMLTNWKKIRIPFYKKILYTFTYPLFILTYLPIGIVCLFKQVEWKPITHYIAVTVDEIENNCPNTAPPADKPAGS